MSRGPGRLVEMSRFFVCLGRSLKNSKKPWVAGVKTFFFGGHQKNHAKTTTVPVLYLKNMVTLILTAIQSSFNEHWSILQQIDSILLAMCSHNGSFM